MIDKIKLKLPLFGDLLRKSSISRFSPYAGTLVTSGVPILQALNITRDTAGNATVADAVTKVHDAVKEGESIVQPLEASGVFPPMVISMVDVGEETGQLPEMLLKIAEVYDDEVDNAVEALTSLLEPIMIVLLALDRRHDRHRALHAAHRHHQRHAGTFGRLGIRRRSNPQP